MSVPAHVLTILWVLLAIALLLVISLIIYHVRMRQIKSTGKKLTQRLELYLTAGDIQMWVYDAFKEMFITFSNKTEIMEEYNRKGFSAFFNDDDYWRMCQHIDYLVGGGKVADKMTVRCHSIRRPDMDFYFDTKITVFSEEKGRPRMILGTMQNVNETRRRHIEIQQLMLRYNTMFNKVDVDLAFFDKNGRLTDINDSVCRRFKIKDKEEVLQKGITLLDFPTFDCDDIEHFEGYHCSTIKPQFPDLYNNNVKYYEHEMIPLYYEGHFMGILSLGLDITWLVHNYQAERAREQHIINETKKQNDYIRNINYALEVSKVWLIHYHPDSRTLEITRSLNEPMVQLTQMRCLMLTDEKDKQKVANLMMNMDKRKTRHFEVKLKTTFKSNGRDTILRFSGFPVYNSHGQIDYYFGLCRDISVITETNRRLEEEMKRAREAEMIKTAFMKNISYDIRTPLNSVVGFAQLFNFEHTEEDEQIFIQEIRNNSNILLKLINDILFMSRLDANMVEITPKPTDFAMTFSTHLMTGWTRELRGDVKTVIDEQYEHLVVTIDEPNVGKIVELLAESSAHFTHEGAVKGKYEYHHDNLEICIEDTGIGIDKQSLKLMFNDINNNVNTEQSATRLKLQICNKLVARMGGHMDIVSELGRGTTIWVRIPCQATLIKKLRVKS